MTREASSTSLSAETLSRYEKSAHSISVDRDTIIRVGFREWLLAFDSEPAPVAAIITRRGHMSLQLEPMGKELVILVANLIGGVMDESDRKN